MKKPETLIIRTMIHIYIVYIYIYIYICIYIYIDKEAQNLILTIKAPSFLASGFGPRLRSRRPVSPGQTPQLALAGLRHPGSETVWTLNPNL